MLCHQVRAAHAETADRPVPCVVLAEELQRFAGNIPGQKIMIPRPSRGYFFNGRSPSLLATPKGRTHGLPLAMKLLLATRKRVFNVEG